MKTNLLNTVKEATTQRLQSAVRASACKKCGTPTGIDCGGERLERICPKCMLRGMLMEWPETAEKKGALTGRALGSYDVLALLGSGGMGAVYRARQRGLGRDVALKVISIASGSERLQRFLREARALARLRHPNIISVHEVSSAAGFTFYTMDLVEGYTLREEVKRGPLAPRRAAEVVALVARAIQHAHERGIIHRDLKPSNILLGEEGVPMVADFGLARDMFAKAHLTEEDAMLGTGPYMAPEQAAGKSSEVGPRTDVYALGAVLYECLSGRPPFEGRTIIEVLAKVQSERPRPISAHRPDVPPALERIAAIALAKRPEDRQASARDLARELERFLERSDRVGSTSGALRRPSSSELEAAPPWLDDAPVRWRGPRLTHRTLAALLLLVLALGGLAWTGIERSGLFRGPEVPRVAEAEMDRIRSMDPRGAYLYAGTRTELPIKVAAYRYVAQCPTADDMDRAQSWVQLFDLFGTLGLAKEQRNAADQALRWDDRLGFLGTRQKREIRDFLMHGPR